LIGKRLPCKQVNEGSNPFISTMAQKHRWQCNALSGRRSRVQVPSGSLDTSGKGPLRFVVSSFNYLEVYVKKIIVAVAALLALFAGPAFADHKDSHNPGGEKVVICHATSSETNPYVRIEVSVNAIGGHFDNPGTPLAGHEDDLYLPAGSACPGGSTEPTDPVTPTDPTDPTDPVTPTDPVDPTTPVVPEVPETPESPDSSGERKVTAPPEPAGVPAAVPTAVDAGL
jgi:hypothetical protein